MGLQCPDGAQKARAPALPGARVVALTSPSSSSHRSPFPPFHSKDKKKKNQANKKTQHFSHASLSHSVFTSSPRLHRDRCSTVLFFFFFVFSCGSFFFVVVVFFARWYHQQFVMRLRRNNGISQPAVALRGGEGWGGFPPSEANRGAYLFIQVRSATRKIPCPASSAAPKCRSVRLPGSFAPS